MGRKSEEKKEKRNDGEGIVGGKEVLQKEWVVRRYREDKREREIYVLA